MDRPLSMELREWVVAAIESGTSTRQSATRFTIGIAPAGAWARLKRAKGEVTPARQGKPNGFVLDAHADFIFALVEEMPDITLEEIAERLAEERGVRLVYTAVWKFLDRHDMTHKKVRSGERPPRLPAGRFADRTEG